MLQETDPEQVKDLADHLNLPHFHFSGRTDARHNQPEGVALLTRWPLQGVHSHRLPSLPEQPGRDLLSARIDTPIGPLAIATTHLIATPDAGAAGITELPRHTEITHARLKQIHTLLARLPAATEVPLIFGGDLNLLPDGEEYRALTGHGLADAWRQRPRSGTRATVTSDNPYLADEMARYHRYASNDQPRHPGPYDYCLDYQFTRGEVTARRCWLIGRPKDGTTWPTDHLGLLATYSPTCAT